MSDDGIGILLIFVKKIVGAREGYLIDILVDLLGGHAYAAVRDGDRAGILVDLHFHLQVAQFALEVALGGQRLQLLRGIYGVAYDLTDEDLVVGIQKLLDYREYILCRYSNITFLHDSY